MSDLFWAGVRLAVALPLVLGLAYLVLRYALPKCMSGLTGGRRMRVVEQLQLGPKAALTLVRVGDRYYLLAYREGSVALVKEYDELPAVIDADETELSKTTPLTPVDPLFKRLGASGSLRGGNVRRG